MVSGNILDRIHGRILGCILDEIGRDEMRRFSCLTRGTGLQAYMYAA
jgi:hypothetical protein